MRCPRAAVETCSLLTSLVEPSARSPHVLVSRRRVPRIVLAGYINVPNEKVAPKHQRREPPDLASESLCRGTTAGGRSEDRLGVDEQRNPSPVPPPITKHPLDRKRNAGGLQGPRVRLETGALCDDRTEMVF